MPERTVEQRVKEILADQLGLEESDLTNNDAHLMDDLGADSIDLVETVMCFEEEFEIGIPDEDGEKLNTVQECIDLVTRLSEPDH